MFSLSIKRVAAVGIVLGAALILWKMRKMTEKPYTPAPWLETAKKLPTPSPVPAEVSSKIAVIKKLVPVKPSSRPAPATMPAKPIAPVGQVPQTIVLPPTQPPAAPLEWQGNDTSIEHPGEVVIRNDHQWVQFWAEHRPHEAAPEVDFTQAMVVGVFAGPRPADQFTIRMVDIRTLPGSLTVDYQEKLPPPGTFAVNVTVYPYQFKVIPRTTLPVKFNKLAPINPNR